MSGTLQNVVQATGKVKTYQISNGLLKLLALPIVYVIHKCGGDVVTYLWVLIVFSIVGLFVQLEVVNRLISEFLGISDFSCIRCIYLTFAVILIFLAEGLGIYPSNRDSSIDDTDLLLICLVYWFYAS